MIVPSDNHNFMVWLFCSDIAIRPFFIVIKLSLRTAVSHRAVKSRLHASVFKNGFFYFPVIFSFHDLYFLHMLYGRKFTIRLSVSERIVFFVYRSLPSQKICHRHGIFAARFLVDHKRIAHAHMIRGQLEFFFGKQG